LADQHEEWANGVRYFEMDDYWDWRNENQELVSDNGKIVTIG